MPLKRTDCAACAKGRACTGCRRARILAMVTAALPGVPPGMLAAAVDTVAGHGAAARSLATALAAAGYLRAVLVANHVLPPRDEKLAAAERLTALTLTGIKREGDRRLVQAYATWQVLRRLRATAAHADRPRTYNNHARINVNTAVDLLNWLADRQRALADLRQGDIDTYLADAPPSRYRVRDFLQSAAAAGHTGPVTITTLGRKPGPSAGDERWAQINQLLHDQAIELTDRVAGALLLLYGQQLSRISEITHDQITTRDGRSSSASAATTCTSPNPSAAC